MDTKTNDLASLGFIGDEQIVITRVPEGVRIERIAECIECAKTGPVTVDSLEYGDAHCAPCWDNTLDVWAEMDRADRYTRGAEGGWCDL